MEKVRLFLNKNINIMCTMLFASFMLLQFITLRMANSAGLGYLSAVWRDRVYLFIQIIVITGIVLHALLYRFISEKIGGGGFTALMSALCAALTVVMLFMSESSAAYLVVAAVTVLCLGFLCGAVYLKLSEFIGSGAKAGMCIAVGYSIGVALQYTFQLRWTVKPVLALLLVLSAAALAFIFLSKPSGEAPDTEHDVFPVSRSKLIFICMITLAMLVFTNLYNICIHHLQIAADYTEYNVYTWPRLLMIPTVMLLGYLAEIKGRRLLPVCCLCTVTLAMLNAVLGGSGTYLLGMCLYYVSFAAVVSYYNVTFTRIAQSTKKPALWAVMGRILDSAFVIITFIPGYSLMSGAAALMLDIAALCVIIVLMSVNGDLTLRPQPIAIAMPEPLDPFPAVAQQYGITAGELKVLREIVLTDDKHEAIAMRLGFSVSTVRHYVSSIYKKTGTQTRLALSKLVENLQKQ